MSSSSSSIISGSLKSGFSSVSFGVLSSVVDSSFFGSSVELFELFLSPST
jgi:hypothetical protein